MLLSPVILFCSPSTRGSSLQFSIGIRLLLPKPQSLINFIQKMEKKRGNNIEERKVVIANETPLITHPNSKEAIENYKKLLEQGKTSPFAYIQDHAKEDPTRTAIIQKLADSIYEEMSYKELSDKSTALAQAIVKHDLAPEKIIDGAKYKFIGAFISNKKESIIIDLACMISGSITVFVYEDFISDLEYILNKNYFSSIILEPKYVEDFFKKMEAKRVPVIKNLILFEKLDTGFEKKAKELGINWLIWRELLEEGKLLTYSFPPISEENPFCLLVTSGSTAKPKNILGCNKNMIFHNNGYSDIPFTRDDVFCIASDFSYICDKFFGLGILCAGGKVIFYDNEKENIFEMLSEFNPTVEKFVPKMLNCLYSHILEKIEQLPLDKKEELKECIQKKIEYMKSTKQNKHPELDTILSPLKCEYFGSQVTRTYFVGAMMRNDVLDFFRAILSCPIISLYGSTEIVGPAIGSDNFHSGNNIGTVLPGFEFKLVDFPEKNYFVNHAIDGKPAPRGELYIRGPTLPKGYFDDREISKMYFKEDGWFITKDIMEYNLENQNFDIIDRANNIKKLSNMYYINEEYLEKIYEESKFISQFFIHVESEKDCMVTIAYPEKTALKDWAFKHNLSSEIEDLCRNEELIKEILFDLKVIAQKYSLNLCEYIPNLALTPEPFSQKNGCLSISGKYRRKDIAKIFKTTLDKLYDLAGKK